MPFLNLELLKVELKSSRLAPVSGRRLAALAATRQVSGRHLNVVQQWEASRFHTRVVSRPLRTLWNSQPPASSSSARASSAWSALAAAVAPAIAAVVRMCCCIYSCFFFFSRSPRTSSPSVVSHRKHLPPWRLLSEGEDIVRVKDGQPPASC